MTARDAWRSTWVALIGWLALGIGGTRAESITGNYSANHVALFAGSQSFFAGPTVTDASGPSTDFETAAPPSEPHPPYNDVATASSSLLPTIGAGKDIAQGTVQVTFTSGTATTNDAFAFTFTGSGSALAAKNSACEDASAQVGMRSRIGFFLHSGFGPSPVPPDTLVGSMTIQGLRAANPYESYVAFVDKDAATIATMLPGGPDLHVNLITGHAYTIDLKYDINVPHGVDPSFSLGVGGQLAPTPEPSALALAVLGPVGLTVCAISRTYARTP
jgi:hypothetical protein